VILHHRCCCKCFYLVVAVPLVAAVMEFTVDPLVGAEDLDYGYDIVIPTLANAVFTYSDERGIVGWLPHPRLTDSLAMILPSS